MDMNGSSGGVNRVFPERIVQHYRGGNSMLQDLQEVADIWEREEHKGGHTRFLLLLPSVGDEQHRCGLIVLQEIRLPVHNTQQDNQPFHVHVDTDCVCLHVG